MNIYVAELIFPNVFGCEEESPEMEMMVTVEIAFDWSNSTNHTIPTFMTTSTVIASIKCWGAIIFDVLQTSKKGETTHEIQGLI